MSRGPTSTEFKLTAVKLSGMPGIQVQTVANALDIHPFMLSRCRKEARVAEGSVRAPKPDGTFLDLVFCDVFDMRNGKIRRLISYLMEVK